MWLAFPIVFSSHIWCAFIDIIHVNWKQKVLWNTATEIKPRQKCISIIQFQNKSAVFDKDQKKIQENSSLKPRPYFHLSNTDFLSLITWKKNNADQKNFIYYEKDFSCSIISYAAPITTKTLLKKKSRVFFPSWYS